MRRCATSDTVGPVAKVEPISDRVAFAAQLRQLAQWIEDGERDTCALVGYVDQETIGVVAWLGGEDATILQVAALIGAIESRLTEIKQLWIHELDGHAR